MDEKRRSSPFFNVYTLEQYVLVGRVLLMQGRVLFLFVY